MKIKVAVWVFSTILLYLILIVVLELYINIMIIVFQRGVPILGTDAIGHTALSLAVEYGHDR